MTEDDVTPNIEAFSSDRDIHMDLPSSAIDPIVELKEKQWSKLTAHLEKWFCEPDMDALKICLSVYAAHKYIDNDPIWLFVISPPGSGKTSIAIKSLTFLPETYSVGDIGINSFLSGFGENNGLLGNITKRNNGNGVILFPDFTSLLSKRHEQKVEIMGQMRQIYDGYYSKSVGNRGDTVFWKGKVTVVAAVTPVLENYWGTHRSLGERFLNVRWKQPDPLQTAAYAERQVEHEAYIKSTFKELVLDYVDIGDHRKERGLPERTEEEKLRTVDIEEGRDLGLRDLAHILSIIRTNITRDHKLRKIIDIDEPESPSRIMKSLKMIAKASASLDRRKSINNHDLLLAYRVAIDSMDKNRGKVMSKLFNGKIINGQLSYECTVIELEKSTKIPEYALKRVIEDLEALEVIRIIDESDSDTRVVLTSRMIKSWDNCVESSVDTLGSGL